MDIVTTSFGQSDTSSDLIKQERIRINFRDFFTYAIKGVQNDPIIVG